MKILFVNPSGGLGWAERVLLNIIDRLHIEYPEIEIQLLLFEDGKLTAQDELKNIKVNLLPLPANLLKLGDSKLNFSAKLSFAIIANLLDSFLALPNFTFSLRKLIKEINPDLVHSNGFKTHILLGLAKFNIPTVWHIQDFVSTRKLAKVILKWIYRDNMIAIVDSRALAKDLSTVIPELAVQTVYNSINTNKFTPGLTDSNYLDRLSDLPISADHTIKIGLVATFAKWKGHELFMQAAAKLIQELQSPLRFYIIGGAIYQTAGSQFSLEELTHQRTQLKLENHLGFIGFQTDTVSIYRSLDIVVHASTQPEPFGMTIIEAMSCGKPVVVSNAGGAAEIIDSGNDAIGFKIGSVEALT